MMGESVRTVGYDASPHYIHLAETELTVLVPRRTDESKYMLAVNSIVREHSIDFIFPNNSLDGELLSRRREELGAPVFLPEPKTFEVGENKWETYRLVGRAGLPVPASWLISAHGNLEEAFASADGAPVWVRGAGIPGKGVGVASLPAKTIDQAVQWVEYWNGWGLMMASEYLDGANLTWLGVWKEGELIASQCRRRDAYVIPHVSPSGITGAPAVSHTIKREDLNRLGSETCLAIDAKFTGPAFVDFKEDGEGCPRITEINVGRFGTTHHFYSVAGANFPELVVRLAFGDELPGWVKPYDVLPADLYWIRTLDAGPVLVTGRKIDETVEKGVVV